MIASIPVSFWPDLRPCPFCGRSNLALGHEREGFWILCRGCNAEGPLGRHKDPAAAGMAWNQRASDPMPWVAADAGPVKPGGRP